MVGSQVSAIPLQFPGSACRSAHLSFVEEMKGIFPALNQENPHGQQEHDLPLV
jgi:hypothetical protein